MILGIYGAGGLGREIYEIALRRNAVSSLWKQILFIDDSNDEGDYFGTKRIQFDALLKIKSECECVVAVGEPSAREKLFRKLSESCIKLTNLIDPTAIISPSAEINNGVIICEYATIHTGVTLGDNTLIQPGYAYINLLAKVGLTKGLSLAASVRLLSFGNPRVVYGKEVMPTR